MVRRIESGPQTGWVATDWVEDTMLRTASLEDYDGWTTGEVKCSYPRVKQAVEEVGKVWFAKDYVLGGRQAIRNTFFGEAPNPMFEDPRGCWMHRQSMFIPNFFPEEVELGVDVNYFYCRPSMPIWENRCW